MEGAKAVAIPAGSCWPPSSPSSWVTPHCRPHRLPTISLAPAATALSSEPEPPASVPMSFAFTGQHGVLMRGVFTWSTLCHLLRDGDGSQAGPGFAGRRETEVKGHSQKGQDFSHLAERGCGLEPRICTEEVLRREEGVWEEKRAGAEGWALQRDLPNVCLRRVPSQQALECPPQGKPVCAQGGPGHCPLPALLCPADSLLWLHAPRPCPGWDLRVKWLSG